MLTELRSGALCGEVFELNPGLRLVAKLMLNSMSTTFSYFYGGRQEQLRTMNNEVSILFFSSLQYLLYTFIFFRQTDRTPLESYSHRQNI